MPIPRGGEVLDQRRAEPARPDDEDPGGLDPGLTGTADLGQDEVAGVAFDLVGGEGHNLPIIRGGADRKR